MSAIIFQLVTHDRDRPVSVILRMTDSQLQVGRKLTLVNSRTSEPFARPRRSRCMSTARGTPRRP